LQSSTVAYNEGHTVQLQNKLILKDAISDLPSVYFILFIVFFVGFFYGACFCANICINIVFLQMYLD
jgi:hypothetical protein